MGTWNTGSVATRVLQIIQDVPADISGTPMEAMASGNAITLGNILNEGVTASAIGEKHQNMMVNLTAATTLSRMTGIGMDVESVSLGEFKINKGAQESSEAQQMQFYLNMLNMEIKGLGRKTHINRTF